MVAAAICNLGIANYFLRRGADPNQVDCAGKTAFVYALASHRPQVIPMIELLHEAGGDFTMIEADEVWRHVTQYRRIDEDSYEDLVERVKEFTGLDPIDELV
jgi:ankyrin repeat protein